MASLYQFIGGAQGTTAATGNAYTTTIAPPANTAGAQVPQAATY